MGYLYLFYFMNWLKFGKISIIRSYYWHIFYRAMLRFWPAISLTFPGILAFSLTNLTYQFPWPLGTLQNQHRGTVIALLQQAYIHNTNSLTDSAAEHSAGHSSRGIIRLMNSALKFTCSNFTSVACKQQCRTHHLTSSVRHILKNSVRPSTSFSADTDMLHQRTWHSMTERWNVSDAATSDNSSGKTVAVTVDAFDLSPADRHVHSRFNNSAKRPHETDRYAWLSTVSHDDGRVWG